MSIQPFRLAAALCFIAAPALALQGSQESGGPIATQAAVNTAPAATATSTPAAGASADAALRAAVLPPKPASAPSASAVSAPPAAAPIATLPSATPAAAVPSVAGVPAAATAGASVYGDAAAIQPTALVPGLTVKDRTGAAIGQVTSIDDDSKLGQLVTVQMGQESFRLSADRFGLWGGAATINLTQADIEAQLHPKR